MTSVHTIILAGGYSRRMGRNKFALDVAGYPLLQRQIALYKPVGDVVVVANPDTADAVRKLAKRIPVLVNPNPEDGMFSSIRLGMAHAKDAEATFVVPVDAPSLGGATTMKLLNSFDENPDADVWIPTWKGEDGHPVLLKNAAWSSRIAEEPATAVFRDVLMSGSMVRVPVNDRLVVLNLNTPEDYNRFMVKGSRMMHIRYFGHACFGFDVPFGLSVLFDPYEPFAFDGRLNYGPIPGRWDYVLVSHEHKDHNYVPHEFGAPTMVREASRFGDLSVRVLEGAHGTAGGTMEARTRIFRAEFSGVSVVHPGDLGSIPVDLKGLHRPDILLVPVGGHFTLDAGAAWELCRKLQPSKVIPMHYKTSDTDLPIETVDRFLEQSPWPVQEKGGVVTWMPGDARLRQQVWRMTPLLGAGLSSNRTDSPSDQEA